MQCPQCGVDVPEDARFCPACGGDMSAEAPEPAPAPVPAAPGPIPVPAPPPTAPMPAVPPPAAPSPAAYAPPAQYAAPAQPGVPGAAPPKKKTGLVIAIVVIALLLLCCAIAGVGGFLYYRAQQQKDTTPSTGTATSKPPTDTDEQAEIEAAATVVEDYYAAIASADMDAIRTLLASAVAEEVGPDWYEGWDPETTFEFTRGVLDGDTATIFGRESVQAYGSGDDGGVKFTLVKEDGDWRITAWAGADRMQIEGADTTGSSSGKQGPLTEASAKNIVTELLEARRAGDANAIRRLTTASFQENYGDVWLDGIDNTEYFLSYTITGVTVGGTRATVTTSEEWISGPEPATYIVVEDGGVLLVDMWN